jgi:hypothetical protein
MDGNAPGLAGARRPGRLHIMKYAVALVLVAAWWLWFRSDDAPAAWTGRAAPESPLQATAGLPRPWTREDLTFQPLATFRIRAVVLGRSRYLLDRESGLAPIDLALGWGPMSDAAAVNAVDVSQGGRWYRWHVGDNAPIDPGSIALHSANMHLIPADDGVRRTLFRVRRHDVVELDGVLVDIRGADGWRWTSSTSRDDTGGGACEVIWVTRLVIHKAGAARSGRTTPGN